MKEFVDFLGSQPPFDALDSQDLDALARTIEVEFFPAGTTIIVADGPRLEHLWLIRAGRVAVSDRGTVVDERDMGDTFGHLSLFSGWPPSFSVTAVEDTLCYRLPDPRQVIQHPERLQFRAYGGASNRMRTVQTAGVDRSQHPVSKYMRPIVWAHPLDHIRDVARQISEAGNSCALIDLDGTLGIVTDNDFRKKVVTGLLPVDARIHQAMSAPCHSVSHSTTVGSALVQMVESGFHHLVVRDDADKPIGVVRVVDLASAEVRDPLVVRRSIEDAQTDADLIAAGQMIKPTAVELFDNGVPAAQIGVLLSTITDALLRRIITLTPAPADLPSASWLVLGSTARQEALPLSDVDTAIVYADGDSEQAPAIRAYAGTVLDLMERAGLPKCPDNANATNPLFTRSQQAWIRDTEQWMKEPETPNALLFSSFVADTRPITELLLGRSVLEHMLNRGRTRPFLGMLLSNALASRPPTGFARGLVVETSGEFRGQLDLKKGGLQPICALGRWFGVVVGDVQGGTVARLQRAAHADIITQDECDSLTAAFTSIYGLLLEQEVLALRTHTKGGTHVDPETLDTLTRRHLRESFRLVRELQDRIENGWNAGVI
jgi:CBS domain-containing protein